MGEQSLCPAIRPGFFISLRQSQLASSQHIGRNMEWNEAFFRHVAQTAPSSPALPIAYGKGAYLFDDQGNKYLDMISGICVTNLGHGVPEIVYAICDQATKYLHPHVYGEVVMAPQVEYAQLLAAQLPPSLSVVYFVNSGAEAIEGALKVAKKYTGREELIAFERAYHGSTHAAMSISGNPAAQKGYGPLLPKVRHLPFNERDALAAITPETAAVVIEVIQGAGGVVLPDKGYLKAVREKCTDTGALLVLDEIQTGIGRTGSLFAFEQEGIIPDILVLAKALGGGLPLGAFISAPQIMGVIQQDPALGHITTFGGGVLACVAGKALLQKLLRDQIMENIPQLEKILTTRLHHPLIKELRGRGLLYALIFENAEIARAVEAAAKDQGVITIGFLGIDHGLRISPPLNIRPSELIEGIEALQAAMDVVLR